MIYYIFQLIKFVLSSVDIHRPKKKSHCLDLNRQMLIIVISIKRSIKFWSRYWQCKTQ